MTIRIAMKMLRITRPASRTAVGGGVSTGSLFALATSSPRAVMASSSPQKNSGRCNGEQGVPGEMLNWSEFHRCWGVAQLWIFGQNECAVLARQGARRVLWRQDGTFILAKNPELGY